MSSRPTVTPAASPQPTDSAALPRNSGSTAGGSHFVRAGSTYCLSVNSFYKVQAIETAGNPYVELPDDCAQVSVNAPVAVVEYAGDLALVRNSGGTVYVQQRDLQ